MAMSKAAREAKALQALAAKSEAEAEKFRGRFALIPATATEHQCAVCGVVQSVRKYPTTHEHGGLHAPQRRTSECRACRNLRQGRPTAVQASTKATTVQAKRTARQGTKHAAKAS